MDEIAENIWSSAVNSDRTNRILVAVFGCPGSGKSYVSKILCDRINGKAMAEVAVILPLDGFHLPRKLLTPDQLRVRGCPSTFDSERFLLKLQQVHTSVCESVFVPSFDHAVKDPVQDDIPICAHHRIVICEGIYVLLPDWFSSSPSSTGIYDKIIFIYSSEDKIIQRIVNRHVQSGLCDTRENALNRYYSSDINNASLVLDSLHSVVESGRGVDFFIDNSNDELRAVAQIDLNINV